MIRHLPSGLIRARVFVTNQTDKRQHAFLYGQPFDFLVYEYPVFEPATVTVSVGGSSHTYIGLLVPAIPAHRSRQVLLQFSKPHHAHPLVAAPSTAVRVSSWSELNNPACVIRPRP